MAKKKTSSRKAKAYKADGSVQLYSLAELHLDHDNPRFGGREGALNNEFDVVDEIVGQHGISDVLSSISINGYIESEPLVGAINRSNGKTITIVEGNRRLTACLIIAGDPRAKRYPKLHEKYRSDLLNENTKIPVQLYDWKDDSARSKLIPYLGIRHIVGASQWDSFAKAAWVAETLENGTLSLEDIKAMMGDTEKFADRIVEGYYFVNQIIRQKVYDPADSLRKGRGSFQEFPFSWCYTALGYKNVRNYLGLPREYQIKPDPIKESHLDESRNLLVFMFGASGTNAAIDDSRKIGRLARALSNDDAVDSLIQGESVDEALDQLKPVEDRVTELLRRSDKSLKDAIAILSGKAKFDMESIVALENLLDDIYERVEVVEERVKSLKKPKRKKRSTRKHG